MLTVKKHFSILMLAAMTALLGGLLIEALLSLMTGWPFGHTQLGHLLGWIGLMIMLLVFGYSIKKRARGKTGWPKAWFWVHQAAGVLAPLLIVIHAGPHFHALVPSLTLTAMVIVALSGLTGIFVHRKALALLNTQRKQLLDQGLSRQEAEERLSLLAAEEAGFRVWQLIHVPAVALFLVLVIAHIGGALYFGGL